MSTHRAKLERPSHDASLEPHVRRMQGAYYTPAAIVQAILAKLLPVRCPPVRWPPDFTLLDPACGDGAFLCGALERWRPAVPSQQWLDALPTRLFGIDRDPEAVCMARQRVARTALGTEASAMAVHQLANTLQHSIVMGDALLAPWPAHWPKQFSAVVGNPPYVNIRRLAQDVFQVAQFRNRFHTAHKAFDLYILFLERACELLASGGKCGFLVPNKLATLEYAEKCRDLLGTKTQIESVLDYSRCRIFPAASVYPWALVFQKRIPAEQHRVHITTFETSANAQPVATTSCQVLQSKWRTERSWSWQADGVWEARLPTKPLAEYCRLHSGTTGFVAQTMRGALQEQHDTQQSHFEFIVSGNIDRYRVSLGNVRYMQHKFVRPVLPMASSVLSENKRRLFSEPKIVFAGMSKQLEAAWDAGGLALGVQVFAAAEFRVDPLLLLALLNSQYYTYLFQTRFCAKRLAGGYFSINKGQLAQLPVPDLAGLNTTQQRRTKQLARLAQACVTAGQRAADFTPLDLEINDLVAQLFQLSPAELAASQGMKTALKAA